MILYIYLYTKPLARFNVFLHDLSPYHHQGWWNSHCRMMFSKNLKEKSCTSYICLSLGWLLICTEWEHHGWAEDMEEEHRQEVWGGGRLYDLFLRATRHKLPAASAVVQDLQEEVPLSLSGKSGVVPLELYHRIFLFGRLGLFLLCMLFFVIGIRRLE